MEKPPVNEEEKRYLYTNSSDKSSHSSFSTPSTSQHFPHKRFTQEVDEIIKQNYCGEKTHWKQNGELLGRTPKSCKDRWNNKLSPKIDNSDCKYNDLLLLDKLVSRYGPKYSRLAGFFPGRNGYQLKNQYSTFLRQKKRFFSRVTYTYFST